MEFKVRLKELRIESGFSQVDIAKKLNMSKMAISHWEKGSGQQGYRMGSTQSS